MYKLVAIDLDGTLLNSYGEVSEKTKIEIKKAIENGVEVVLASGRPISSVEDLANDLQANHYLISKGKGIIVIPVELANEYKDEEMTIALTGSRSFICFGTSRNDIYSRGSILQKIDREIYTKNRCSD